MLGVLVFPGRELARGEVELVDDHHPGHCPTPPRRALHLEGVGFFVPDSEELAGAAKFMHRSPHESLSVEIAGPQ
jgi:hypothetical protein